MLFQWITKKLINSWKYDKALETSENSFIVQKGAAILYNLYSSTNNDVDKKIKAKLLERADQMEIMERNIQPRQVFSINTANERKYRTWGLPTKNKWLKREWDGFVIPQSIFLNLLGSKLKFQSIISNSFL